MSAHPLAKVMGETVEFDGEKMSALEALVRQLRRDATFGPYRQRKEARDQLIQLGLQAFLSEQGGGAGGVEIRWVRADTPTTTGG